MTGVSPKKEAPMNRDNKLIEKVNYQLEMFVKILSKGLSKPKKKFIHHNRLPFLFLEHT